MALPTNLSTTFGTFGNLHGTSTIPNAVEVAIWTLEPVTAGKVHGFHYFDSFRLRQTINTVCFIEMSNESSDL